MADQRKNSPRRPTSRRSTSGGATGRTGDRASRAAAGSRTSTGRPASSKASPSTKRGTASAPKAQRGGAAQAAAKKKGGGRPPVNLWPRRIITGLGLILILALIVWGIVAAVRAIAGAFTADPAPQSAPQSAVQSGALDASGYTLKGGQEATADGLLTDGTTIDIPSCLDRDITATATASATSSGSAMPVTLTLENRGSVACSTSLSRFALQISTGDLQVYNSAKCGEDQQSSATLLLRPGATWSGALRWDGYVYTNGCTTPAGGASAASAGTYKVAVTMGTREVGSTVVDVTPAPTPAPQSGAQSGAQSGR